MTSDDGIYYLNYPVKEDIQAMVQAKSPSYYETSEVFDLSTVVEEADGTKRVPLPDDCVYPLEIQPEKYPRARIEATDKYDVAPYNVVIDDDEMVIPDGSPYDSIQMWYLKEIPLITDVDEELPYPSKMHRELVPVLLYGMCLEFFRDRKKANDIKIYADKYEQARMNIATLSVRSLF